MYIQNHDCLNKISSMFFCFVVPHCNYWTNYFSVDTPDDGCDNENFTSIISVFPKEICAVPTAVDARRISDKCHWTELNQSIAISGNNFKCSSFQNIPCDDFEVRFCCPQGEVNL